jgi:hypothetical protein
MFFNHFCNGKVSYAAKGPRKEREEWNKQEGTKNMKKSKHKEFNTNKT